MTGYFTISPTILTRRPQATNFDYYILFGVVVTQVSHSHSLRCSTCLHVSRVGPSQFSIILLYFNGKIYSIGNSNPHLFSFNSFNDQQGPTFLTHAIWIQEQEWPNGSDKTVPEPKSKFYTRLNLRDPYPEPDLIFDSGGYYFKKCLQIYKKKLKLNIGNLQVVS